jgi:imidazolonepropionase-like amidohydrolase/ABC-type multidrug transport system permease subunit
MMKAYFAQTASNLRLMGRDRAVLFYSYLFPLVFFFVFSQVFHAGASPGAMAQTIAMVLIIGVLGNGLFGAGLRTVLDRETNILRRFKVAPINAGPIIVASMISGLVAFLPTVFLFLFFGRFIYHAPFPHNLLSLLFFISIGLLAFRALGMIIASVVNSQQEATILIQLLYLPMLFLSGATFPTSIMPEWVQTIANFLPATYLYRGMRAILLEGQSAFARQNLVSALCLILAMAVALFVGIKLFRWEKEEKIAGKAKLWVLVVLAPFFISGIYQAKTREGIEREKILDRETSRMRSVLFNNVNIFVGNGETIQSGAVLTKNGKIVQVFRKAPDDTKSFNADVIEEAGKTLLPGLIDMHVHIGAPGGVYDKPEKYAMPNADARRLAAYLYSGVTAVRSTGDLLENAIALRKTIASGKYEGAEFFSCGPLFTAEGGHPQELLKNFPDLMRQTAKEQFLRQPKTAAEARTQVIALKQAGVDCIKAVLEAGNPIWGQFNRLDSAIYQAVIEEASKQGLPSATHTDNAADVKLAVEAGTNSIEHGSPVDLIDPATFAEMKARGIAYDPTLSVYEGLAEMRQGRTQLLNRPLLLQAAPADLLSNTQTAFSKPQENAAPQQLNEVLERLNQNLLTAYQSGVMLIAGSDAGNMLVIHGPTVQHELELWVNAKIPPAVALQAATYNAAKALHADHRFGLIREGMDATFIILDGDPLQDISATEHINAVYLRGEHIDRSDLFDQFKP